MMSEERSGNVKFSVVRNDNKVEVLLSMLQGIKNKFVKQLTRKPRPHVSRLVLDQEKESLALFKRNAKGGCVVMKGYYYRLFTEQEFREIGFLAISQSEHARRYSSRLTVRSKEKAKKLRSVFLLTCADKNAVRYFKKQRFSKKISLAFDR